MLAARYPEGTVLRLRKALYGLRAAPRHFSDHIRTVLEKLGMSRHVTDPCLFSNADKTLCLALHVDDLIVAAVTRQQANEFMKQLGEVVLLKVGEWLSAGGEPVRYLGRLYTHTTEGVIIQLVPGYFEELLDSWQLFECRAAPSPGPTAQTEQVPEDRALDGETTSLSRSAVGKLMFSCGERPDLAYATKELARCMREPQESDLAPLKKLLRYLKGTLHHALVCRVAKRDQRDSCGGRCQLGRMPSDSKVNHGCGDFPVGRFGQPFPSGMHLSHSACDRNQQL